MYAVDRVDCLCCLLRFLDGVAASRPGSAEATEDNDHVTSVAEVDQRRSSAGDVRAAGSTSNCRGAKFTATVHPINHDVTQFVQKISLPLITDRVSGEDVAIGRVLESVNSKRSK